MMEDAMSQRKVAGSEKSDMRGIKQLSIALPVIAQKSPGG